MLRRGTKRARVQSLSRGRQPFCRPKVDISPNRGIPLYPHQKNDKLFLVVFLCQIRKSLTIIRAKRVIILQSNYNLTQANLNYDELTFK